MYKKGDTTTTLSTMVFEKLENQEIETRIKKKGNIRKEREKKDRK